MPRCAKSVSFLGGFYLVCTAHSPLWLAVKDIITGSDTSH